VTARARPRREHRILGRSNNEDRLSVPARERDDRYREGSFVFVQIQHLQRSRLQDRDDKLSGRPERKGKCRRKKAYLDRVDNANARCPGPRVGFRTAKDLWRQVEHLLVDSRAGCTLEKEQEDQHELADGTTDQDDKRTFSSTRRLTAAGAWVRLSDSAT
jgi:hypothetical protein